MTLTTETLHQIGQAVAVLQTGGVIGCPTETVYGLSGDAARPAVFDQIAELKSREASRSCLALLPSLEWAEKWSRPFDAATRKLMETFWPGPLTLVLPASEACPAPLVSDIGFVGMRWSPDPVCEALLQGFGRPVLSTSANPTGKAPAESAKTVRAYFGRRLEVIVDGGSRAGGIPSTVCKIEKGEITILREGAVSRDQILDAAG